MSDDFDSFHIPRLCAESRQCTEPLGAVAGQNDATVPSGIVLSQNPAGGTATSPVDPGAGDRISVTAAGSCDGGGGLFLDIEGAAVLEDGSWYAADKLGYRVYRLSPAGAVTAQAGRRGKRLGEFEGPGPVAARGGVVAVADFAGRRIQRLSAGLRPEQLFEAPGPVFDMEDVYSCCIDKRGGSTRLFAGPSSVSQSLASGADGLATRLRNWRIGCA